MTIAAAPLKVYTSPPVYRQQLGPNFDIPSSTIATSKPQYNTSSSTISMSSSQSNIPFSTTPHSTLDTQHTQTTPTNLSSHGQTTPPAPYPTKDGQTTPTHLYPTKDSQTTTPYLTKEGLLDQLFPTPTSSQQHNQPLPLFNPLPPHPPFNAPFNPPSTPPLQPLSTP